MAVTEGDLRWLAAATNGEGSVNIIQSRRGRGGTDFQPVWTFTNSDPVFVDEVERLATLIVGERPRRYTKLSPLSGRPLEDVRFNGIKAVTLIKALIPYLFGVKLQQAQEVVNYRVWREAQPYHNYDKSVAAGFVTSLRTALGV